MSVNLMWKCRDLVGKNWCKKRVNFHPKCLSLVRAEARMDLPSDLFLYQEEASSRSKSRDDD